MPDAIEQRLASWMVLVTNKSTLTHRCCSDSREVGPTGSSGSQLNPIPTCIKIQKAWPDKFTNLFLMVATVIICTHVHSQCSVTGANVIGLN